MTYTPEGYSTLTPVIISKDAKATIESYERALGANVRAIMKCPQSGDIMHASLTIGDSTLFVSDECTDMGIHVTERQEFYLYVENADNAFAQAKKAGYSEVSELQDMFWGDRIGAVKDINGNTWKLAQKVRDVSPEEMEDAIKSMGEAA